MVQPGWIGLGMRKLEEEWGCKINFGQCGKLCPEVICTRRKNSKGGI